MILISLIRKGAFKRLTLSTTVNDYLSLIQVLESADDVVDYHVGELDKYFRTRDLWVRNEESYFPKWKPFPEETKDDRPSDSKN